MNLKNICGLSLIFLLWLVVVHLVMLFTIPIIPAHLLYGDYGTFRYKMVYLASEENPEILMLGDSRILNAVKPSIIPNSANMAIFGTGPVENYYILEKYLIQKNPKYLILSFAPSHFNHLTATTFWNPRFKVTQALTTSDVLDIHTACSTLGEEPLVDLSKEQVYWQYQKQRYHVLPLFHEEVQKNILTKTKARDEWYALLVEEHGYEPAEETGVGGADNAALDDRLLNVSHLMKLYLNRIVHLAAAHDVSIVYLNMPMAKDGYEVINKTALAEHDHVIRTIITSVPGNHYVDDRQVYNNRLFADKTHLDDNGATLFSIHVRNTLAEVGVLG